MFNEKSINLIKTYLSSRKETISVAESVTSGFIQAALSTAKDAAEFYQGGITVYNIGQKSRHLLIEPIHALSCNCVSANIAEQMALNVCGLFNSDWGIGITGYAAPVKESGNKLFAYYALALKGKIVLSKKLTAKKDDPEKVQLFYANQILNDFTKFIK